MKLRTQLLLISVGLWLGILAVINTLFLQWNAVWLELGGVALYAASYWVLAALVLKPVEILANQTSEALAGSRVTLAIRAQSPELHQLVGSLDGIFLRLHASKKAMHQFLGDASHELRTPLTVISAYLQLLGQPESQANAEYVAKSIEKMTIEAQRMQRLIDDLLQLAEIGESAPLGGSEAVDLSRLVTVEADSLRDLQPDRPVTLALPSQAFVMGNADLLAQLVANLFANIRRHTAANAPVQVDLVSGVTWVSLTCNDGGPGLSAEAYASGIQHFQRYDQSRSRDSGGSGLGMSIMASIVERHGGQISVSPSVLGGLCTRITFPLQQVALNPGTQF